MKLLSINAGSSSLKFKLYNMPSEDVLIYGYIDKIGFDTEIKIVINGDITTKYDILKNHDEAVNYLINVLTEYKVINSLDEINGVGHRVVNGAGKFSPEIVTDELIQRLEKFKFLSLVHMTGHIAGIKAFKNILRIKNKEFSICLVPIIVMNEPLRFVAVWLPEASEHSSREETLINVWGGRVAHQS